MSRLDPGKAATSKAIQSANVSARGWGHVSSWWSKPLKELKLATFNARAETVATKPMFRSAFKRNRCLIPVSGYYEWQDTLGGKQPGTSPRGMARRH
jgi:putative SOS response-associated peptidase YedK